MNAVNLIPRDSRTRGAGIPVSPPTLALAGGLVVALIAAVLYVTTANTVATRKSELAQVGSGVAGWTAAANSYASFVQAAQRRTQELADVRQLASSRFPWSDLLGQIGGLMPKAAALSTLQAATNTTSSTSSTPSTSGASVPGVQLSGCAASQSVVAQTMVQLRRVNGVSAVTLSSSSDSGSPERGLELGEFGQQRLPVPGAVPGFVDVRTVVHCRNGDVGHRNDRLSGHPSSHYIDPGSHYIDPGSHYIDPGSHHVDPGRLAMTLRPRDRMALAVVLIVALAGAYYLLALKPEQNKASTLASSITAQRQALTTAEANYATGKAAQASIRSNAPEWAALRKAVPDASDIPALLRVLERNANAVHVKMKAITLSAPTSAAGGTPPPSTATPSTGGAGSAATAGADQHPAAALFRRRLHSAPQPRPTP